jgi:hypothetical protein
MFTTHIQLKSTITEVIKYNHDYEVEISGDTQAFEKLCEKHRSKQSSSLQQQNKKRKISTRSNNNKDEDDTVMATIDPLQQRFLSKMQTMYEKQLADEINRQSLKMWILYENAYFAGHLSGTSSNSTEDSCNNKKALRGLLLLGPQELRACPYAIRNFGIVSEDVHHRGCILDGKWSLLRNDLFMLAAIQSSKQIMLFLPAMEDNNNGTKNHEMEGDIGALVSVYLRNRTTNQVSILCRELALLYAAGYRRFVHPHERLVGLTFLPQDLERCQSFSINDVIAASQHVNPETVSRHLLSCSS